MMRRTALTLLAALAAVPTLAQTNVGVVDFETVIQRSQKGQAAFAEIETYRQTKQGELDSMIEAFRAKQESAQAQVNSLSEERARELSTELQVMQTNIKRAQEDAEREGQRRTNEALAGIDRQLGPLVQQIAEERGLHLVLQYRPELGIVYVDGTINITGAVIERFDALE